MTNKETRTITVSSEALESIRCAAMAAEPLEACGLLLGPQKDAMAHEAQPLVITNAVEARNAHPTPMTHFEIEPKALIAAYRQEREGGPQLVGYFHSHPTGHPVPSLTDQEQSACDGRVWAIAAGQEVRFWIDQPDGFELLEVITADM